MTLRPLRRGFTLIELLLVIGIIAILAAIVIVAINPTKQLGDARNAQRRSDVNTILNAVYQYSIDHNGTLPAGIPDTVGTICKTAAASDCTVVLSTDLTSAYIVAIPADPQGATATSAGYTIVKDATSKRVTVAAPSAEQGAVISVTR